ncbi:hypothetical protein M438DRAFT_348157 [Aureobasidium pullulans EXF-150]|uniref:Secreted protein n=1 Tax=Aureobasidium pullulans EXF-150 TaxID=1043002 RepID=A0A074X710_AURPU|nr:uncharacterized protein M438DRAFT_348157 [Aureobasidium pullulans EXF-150]KEQ81305.1 hypothetical protein M438DRAFT_348157 [Aureobasidium pullulans EXF-150]
MPAYALFFLIVQSILSAVVGADEGTCQLVGTYVCSFRLRLNNDWYRTDRLPGVGILLHHYVSRRSALFVRCFLLGAQRLLQRIRWFGFLRLRKVFVVYVVRGAGSSKLWQQV